MRFILLLLGCLFSVPAFSQSQGLDEKINAKFEPLANLAENVVLYSISVTDTIKIPIVVILLVLGALFFTLAFSFINVRKIGLAIQVIRGKYDGMDVHDPINDDKVAVNAVDGDIVQTIKPENQHGEVNHFQALATAVSGTVGLGNIAGVAAAIGIGGPGATFWMIICGLLGMSSKFVECTLGVKYRDIDENGVVYGGPMYYLSRGLSEIGKATLGKIFGVLFAVLCVGASFGGGNAFQSNQATAQIQSFLKLESGSSGFWIGLILAFLTGIVIIGGIKRIAKVTERIVPIMAILYVGACLFIIFSKFDLLDEAFGQIFSEAFTPTATVGGLVGVIIIGFKRAAFSNEAGAGSAAIAHSAVKTKYPASEGIVALLEPFIDTVVICTMTALVIILFNMGDIFVYGGYTSNVILKDTGESIGGVGLTSMAFDAALPGFSKVLTIAIVLFAFSTMISWSYYGLQAWKYLFGRGKKADLTYKLIYLLFIIVGAASTLDAVIRFSDAMILALVFPNMIGLLLLFPKVKEELKTYLDAINVFKTSK